MIGDDSPGLTDYPRRDIDAHRHVAKWNARFAGALVIGAVFVETTSSLVLAVAALMYAASLSMRLQALRWEARLED